MDLVCSWSFLSFFLFWQRLKLLVISEYRAIGELEIRDHSRPFELLSGVRNSEWHRSQLSDRLAHCMCM